MLEEEVIFAFVIDQAVGVIHPIAIWCEMKLWAIFLVAKFSSWMRNHGTYLILTGVDFITSLFDASSVVSTLGLLGVLGIIFMETGLLIGLVFPGGEVVFLAGIAASRVPKSRQLDKLFPQMSAHIVAGKYSNLTLGL